MPDIVLKATNVAKTYQEGKLRTEVLRDVNLSVRRGETLAIVGASGTGKSTLLHILGGLDAPSAGEVEVDGRTMSRLSDRERGDLRNRSLGFVYQFHHLLPEFTALENVCMPLLIRGVRPEEAAHVARMKLDEVGLSARETHRAGELSGGEQQRIALARALAGKPRVLMADEPTGNLDYRTGEMILSLLTDLHRTHDLTSVFVTHNLSFAERCDRVLELKKGRLSLSEFPGLQPAGVARDATRLDGGNYV